jgi:uncharacterized Zn finger protein
VELHLDPFSDEDWHYVVATLAERARYSAQLLTGALPESIEQVFIQNGLNLFPFSLGEVHSQCSCPDKANPCKHIGAVYYQLADQFREDPFVIFRLRGRSRGQLLTQLKAYRRRAPDQLADFTGAIAILETVTTGETTTAIPSQETPVSVSPSSSWTEDSDQPTLAAHFWDYGLNLPGDLVVIAPGDNPLQTVDRLGDVPLNYELAKDIRQAIAQVYPTLSQAALMQVMGG